MTATEQYDRQRRENRRVFLLAALALGLTVCGRTTTSRSSSTSSVSTTEARFTTTTAPELTTTTVPPTTDAPPTSQQIAAEIANTHETTDPSEGFIGSLPVTVSDGTGGYLTAVSALRNPSADGHGDLIFFWHNQTFLGWGHQRRDLERDVACQRHRRHRGHLRGLCAGQPRVLPITASCDHHV